MNWRSKAAIQRMCASAPGGPTAYRYLQRRRGRLVPDPFERLHLQAELARNLMELGLSIDGARCLEVGTGHVPVAPLGFYLCGATETLTVDLHRRMDISVTRKMLETVVDSDPEVASVYEGLVPLSVIRDRLDAIRPFLGNPADALRRAGIRYLAPGNAGWLASEATNSFDIHFSIMTLEHISDPLLLEVLNEGRRLLKPTGIAAHLINPGDHFEHTDRSILPINFLQFSEDIWQKIGGNEFSYCNRLRGSDIERLFGRAGLATRRALATVDGPSLLALANNFPLDERFGGYDAADLATTRFDVYASPE